MDELYSFINNENHLYDLFRKELNSDTKVLCMGCGGALHYYLKLLRRDGIEPYLIIDNDINKQGTKYMNIQIVSLNNAIELCKGNDYNVIITSPTYAEEFYKTLLLHMDSRKIYSFEIEEYYNFISDINEYKKYLLSNWDKLNELYNCLDDSLSKKTMISVIKGRISGNLEYYKDVMQPNQYFPADIIKLGKDESIIECGSNNGKTLIDIIHYCNGSYKTIYCLEPDKKFINNIKDVVESHKLENINIINKGAWSETTTLSFKIGEESGTSKIVDKEEYTEKIDVVALDSIINEKITFIKMDIEGAELNALIGCKNIIEIYKPKLAICVYHKKEDLIEITDYIKSINPEYKFYLRHHHLTGFETVLYAI